MEEPKALTVRVGSTVSFICTAKSKVNPLAHRKNIAEKKKKSLWKCATLFSVIQANPGQSRPIQAIL